MYALTNLHEQENSPNVVIDMIRVFEFTFCALLDPRASLFFVTSYVAMNFEVSPENLENHSVCPHLVVNPF